jgi:general secretion pathway protein I
MNKRGFTLLEVLVAISVLSIAIVALIQLFSGSLRTVSVSSEYSRAVTLAEARMRELQAGDSLKEGSSTETTKEGYRVYIDVRKSKDDEADASVPLSLYEITLTMSWGAQGRQRSFTLNTMKVARPLI